MDRRYNAFHFLQVHLVPNINAMKPVVTPTQPRHEPRQMLRRLHMPSTEHGWRRVIFVAHTTHRLVCFWICCIVQMVLIPSAAVSAHEGVLPSYYDRRLNAFMGWVQTSRCEMAMGYLERIPRTLMVYIRAFQHRKSTNSFRILCMNDLLVLSSTNYSIQHCTTIGSLFWMEKSILVGMFVLLSNK